MNWKEEKDRLQLLMDNLPIVIDAFDENGLIIVWNKECKHVTMKDSAGKEFPKMFSTAGVSILMKVNTLALQTTFAFSSARSLKGFKSFAN